jgi:trigger factor
MQEATSFYILIMNIARQDLEKSQVELTITVELSEVRGALEKASNKLSGTIQIPGFRGGKAPYEVMQRAVGEARILEEAFQGIVTETLPKAIEQEKIEIAGAPQIDVVKLAPGNPIVYKARISLLPRVTLQPYQSLSVERRAVTVTDEDVVKTIEQLRRLRAKETLVLRPARNGDRVEIDFTISLENVPIEGGVGTKHSVVLGSGQFVPGFEEQLIGMKTGEEKAFDLTFPKDYHAANLADRATTVKVNMGDVYEIELPDVNDEFAKAVGQFENMEALKKQIQENIQQEREMKEDQRYEGALVEALAKQATVGDLPENLVDSELDKMFHELETDVARRGMLVEDYLKHIKKSREELRAQWRSRAAQRLKMALTVRQVAIEEKIEVSEDELDSELGKLRTSYHHDPEILKQINTPAYRDYTRNVMKNQKVFKRLKEFASSEKK